MTLTDDLLSESEVAELLGKSVASLRRWARRGEGPPRTVIGNSRRYRRSTVERWLLEQEERRAMPRR